VRVVGTVEPDVEIADDVDGHLVGGESIVDHMQTICTLIQTDNDTTSSLCFYRPHTLPDVQLTASVFSFSFKAQKAKSTEGK